MAYLCKFVWRRLNLEFSQKDIKNQNADITLETRVVRHMDNFDGHASRGMPHFHFHRLTEAVNEETLSIEAYLDSRIVQRTLISKVKRIASLLANTAEPPDDETKVIPIECVVREISLSV